MAPEQLGHAHVADARADLYAVAVILYQMLSGRLPHPAPSYEDYVVSVRTSVPPPLTVIAPQVWPPLEAVVIKGLAREPQHRYVSADEFSHALEQAARDPRASVAPMKVLVVTAIALLDVRSSEACQPFATTQVVITPPGTTIVDGGGVLFRVATAEESPKTPPVAPATLPGEKEEPLAPGLFRRIYQPSADRKITLAPTVVFPQGGKAAALAAPKLASDARVFIDSTTPMSNPLTARTGTERTPTS
jgi:serine/threonine protein kinase